MPFNKKLTTLERLLLEALKRVTHALGLVGDFGTATEGDHPDLQNHALDNAHDLIAAVEATEKGTKPCQL